MQKITGQFLKTCKIETEKVKKLLREYHPNFVDREVFFEWCNASSYGGVCQISYIRKAARIRLSKKYDHTDLATLHHELIHAFLPPRTFHKEEFTKGMAILKENGLKVTRFAEGAKEEEFAYAYSVDFPNGKHLVVRKQRKTYTIKWLIMHGGECVDNGRVFKLIKKRED